jgi:hypothetical protein
MIPKDKEHTMLLVQARIAHMFPYVDLIPGLPIMVTQNVNADEGVANGTYGYIYNIQFPDDTRFALVKDSCTDLIVLCPNHPPNKVFVVVDHDLRFPVVSYLNLPKYTRPIIMVEKTITIGELPLTAPFLVRRGIPIAKLDICHLPFVNAVVAGTNHKTQGEALSSMAINCSDIIAP